MKKFLLAFLMLSMTFGMMVTLAACNDDSGLQEIRRNADKAQKAIDEMNRIKERIDDKLKNP